MAREALTDPNRSVRDDPGVKAARSRVTQQLPDIPYQGAAGVVAAAVIAFIGGRLNSIVLLAAAAGVGLGVWFFL